jgi:transcriptional regulator with XRE-family HTH domain
MTERIGPRKPRQRAYLREHRKAKGWSQTELANRIGEKGTTKSTISRYETGERDYPGGFLAAAAEALGVDEVDLFRLPEPKSPKQPSEPSIDAMLENEPKEVREQVRAIVEVILKKAV